MHCEYKGMQIALVRGHLRGSRAQIYGGAELVVSTKRRELTLDIHLTLKVLEVPYHNPQQH